MSDLRPSISYLANGFNKTQNNRNAVIYAVESESKIKQKIKIMEQNAWKEVNKTTPKFEFDPNEIEPIILRMKESEER